MSNYYTFTREHLSDGTPVWVCQNMTHLPVRGQGATMNEAFQCMLEMTQDYLETCADMGLPLHPPAKSIGSVNSTVIQISF